MPEQEPQSKATLGNATERLQIKFRNSRSMHPLQSDYPGIVHGTNLVRVKTPLPAQTETIAPTETKPE